MLLVKFAQSRLDAFLNEIDRLKQSEFPHQHSQDALIYLENNFLNHRASLQEAGEAGNKFMIDFRCIDTLKKIYLYLPILGFILRSTNARNGFEICAPFLQLAGIILEPSKKPKQRSTRVLLSSEWDLSPFTYQKIPYLSDFILIGLPATESDNPLLIPLAGHELGHAIWDKDRLENNYRNDIHQNILDAIILRKDAYERLFPRMKATEEELVGMLPGMQTWAQAFKWIIKQLEETFCDLVGLRLFGTAYMHAYAYLTAPRFFGCRNPEYPSSKARSLMLAEAAKVYGYEIPEDYIDLFEDQEKPPLSEQDDFLMEISDAVLSKMLQKILSNVRDRIPEIAAAEPSGSAAENRVFERFKLIVPAENSGGLAPIINAGWRAFLDDDLWKDSAHIYRFKTEILRDLIMKNIEILEVEQIAEGASHVKS